MFLSGSRLRNQLPIPAAEDRLSLEEEIGSSCLSSLAMSGERMEGLSEGLLRIASRFKCMFSLSLCSFFLFFEEVGRGLLNIIQCVLSFIEFPTRMLNSSSKSFFLFSFFFSFTLNDELGEKPANRLSQSLNFQSGLSYISFSEHRFF